MRRTILHSIIVVIFLVIQPASATMLPNPERLLEVSNCEEAKLNLIEARKGSPLISAAENHKIVASLEIAVKRFCAKTEPNNQTK